MEKMYVHAISKDDFISDIVGTLIQIETDDYVVYHIIDKATKKIVTTNDRRHDIFVISFEEWLNCD